MRPAKVLIVSDQRALRRGLRAGLESLQAKLSIVDVRSGEDAILVNSHQPFDLLIADTQLPGLSGIELVEHAQIRNLNLQTILIASPSDPTVRDLGVRAGANAIFYKPVELDKFLRVVRQCLNIEPETREPAASPATLLPPRVVVPEKIVDQVSEPVFEQAFEQVSEQISEPVSARLVERLSELRAVFGAHCVLLVAGDGRLIARAGDLPADVYEELLLRSLANGLRALQATARLAGGSSTRDMALITGERFDLACSHVAGETGLLLVGPPGSFSPDQRGSLFGSLQAAGQDLLALMSGPAGEQTAARLDPSPRQIEDQVQGPEAALASALDEFFRKMKPIAPAEADAFWETAAGEGPGYAPRPDTISYDQARELGLNIDES